MAVAKPETPAWTLRTRVFAAFKATALLFYVMLWVTTLGCVVMAVGRRAFGEIEGSPVLSAASLVIHYSHTVVLKLFPFAFSGILICVLEEIRSVPKDSKKDTKDPLLGGLLLMAFMTLISIGDFVVIQRSWVGPILRDLAPLVIALTGHFIIIPTTPLSLRQCRMK